MSPKHRYQFMPDLSPEDRAALKASIDADGVRVPKDVDEEGNILDGHQRQDICEELGIECPKRVITGLTEAQKIEYAWQVNVARRQLSKAQKRQLAEKLWHNEQTQERIAQLLGVSQSTIGNWLQQFTNSGKLPPPPPSRVKMGSRIRARKLGAAPLIRLRMRTALKPLRASQLRVRDQPKHWRGRNRHNRATPLLKPRRQARSHQWQ